MVPNFTGRAVSRCAAFQTALYCNVPRPTDSQGRRDPDDVAPWIVAEVSAWPRTVADGVVAVRIGVWPHHVHFARAANAPRR